MIDYKNPDYLPVIRARIERLNRIRSDKKLLEASKIHYAHHYNDFIDDWMMTYDPRRAEVKTVPFLLWERQQEYIDWLTWHYREKQHGLVEKSRDAGATYLSMAFALCVWLFEPGGKVSFGSRKEDLVDKIGDPDSIFEKGRMVLRTLPKEYLPHGYDERKHASHMKFINPENGATITGESGDNIGRGGRAGIYFKDEAAFYERPDLIEAALSQNSDVIIDVSTPNGTGNPFHRKRQKYPSEHVFIFDWRDDPRKDDDWYAHQKDVLESWVLAQEVDRDYSASIEGICIPAKYVKAAIGLQIPKSGAIIAGLDVADEGEDSKAITIREGVFVRYIEAWKEGDTTISARKAIQICDDKMVDMLNYDVIGVGAGVKGELNQLKEKITSEGRFFPVTNGVNVGSDEMTGMWDENRSEKDMFVNMKACLYWRLRRRFERTYEYVNGIKKWPIDDLISIPRNEELITELSQTLYEINEAGKIRIESKEKLKKRGLKSPNLAEALILSFANPELIPLNRRSSLNIPSEPARIDAYVKGETKTPPWMIDKSRGGRYVDFGEQ